MMRGQNIVQILIFGLIVAFLFSCGDDGVKGPIGDQGPTGQQGDSSSTDGAIGAGGVGGQKGEDYDDLEGDALNDNIKIVVETVNPVYGDFSIMAFDTVYIEQAGANDTIITLLDDDSTHLINDEFPDGILGRIPDYTVEDELFDENDFNFLDNDDDNYYVDNSAISRSYFVHRRQEYTPENWAQVNFTVTGDDIDGSDIDLTVELDSISFSYSEIDDGEFKTFSFGLNQLVDHSLFVVPEDDPVHGDPIFVSEIYDGGNGGDVKFLKSDLDYKFRIYLPVSHPANTFGKDVRITVEFLNVQIHKVIVPE